MDQCGDQVGAGLAAARLDIVRELYELYSNSQADLRWVRGHEGDEGNELADEWANRARLGERI